MLKIANPNSFWLGFANFGFGFANLGFGFAKNSKSKKRVGFANLGFGFAGFGFAGGWPRGAVLAARRLQRLLAGRSPWTPWAP